ncbi:hypothetical protein HK097_008241 [Rhizophlyctis rosea]|uniref:BCD1 alpha/beta domain-containing protein n=1 Tax=Rhizophlyctis rosea TaxID=64517 RepID=A0AAD5SAL4_9FUNG|nr:hypothetical protein HK097_008241 [Rhizophlyctis rosea]
MSEYNANHMSSDYFLLEEAYRTADLATRDNSKPSARPNKRPSSKNALILKHASKTNTTVKFLSQGMKRREENTSMYLAKMKTISWTIAWDFPQCGVKRLDHRIKDTTTLHEALSKHIEPKPNNAVSRYEIKELCDCGIDNLLVYMKKENAPFTPKNVMIERKQRYAQANQPTYYAIPISSSISKALANKLVIEYPTFIVRSSKPPDNIKITEANEESSTEESSDESSDSGSGSGSDSSSSSEEEEGEVQDEVLAESQVETPEEGAVLPPVDFGKISDALVQDFGADVQEWQNKNNYF